MKIFLYMIPIRMSRPNFSECSRQAGLKVQEGADRGIPLLFAYAGMIQLSCIEAPFSEIFSHYLHNLFKIRNYTESVER